MLRSSISEERASDRGNEDWCGVTYQVLAAREAKRAFLFQICTTASRSEAASRGLSIRFNALLGLAWRVLGGAWCPVSQG